MADQLTTTAAIAGQGPTADRASKARHPGDYSGRNWRAAQHNEDKPTIESLAAEACPAP